MRGPQGNYLSFADDIILFTSGRCKPINIIMHTLKTYEERFGKLINGDKSHFMVHYNAFNNTIDRIIRYTGLTQKLCPLIYLGCPLSIGRPRMIYFFDLVNKIVCRITSWQMKQLSYGGRAIRVKHVLQVLPIKLLSVVTTFHNT